MKPADLTRAERALIALRDYSSRPHVTSQFAIVAMIKDGFTRAEMLAAVEAMLGQPTEKEG